MPEQPILTIAIPTYNGAKTIGETLDSVLAQAEEGVELVISDNASTDDTIAIVDSYRARYSCVNYYRNENNIGPDGNFDAAVRRSQGKFVWLFSDDDLLVPGGVKRVLSVLNKHEEIGALFVNWFNLDDGSRSRIGTVSDTYCSDGNQFLRLVKLYPLLVSANVIRRSLWEESGTPDFIGTNWVHYLVLISVLSKRPSYVIAEPFVGYRRGVGGWKDDHYARLQNTLHLGEFLTKLFTECGFDRKLLYSLKNAGIGDLHHIIRGCRAGRRAIPAADVKRMFTLYSDHSVYWLKSVPAYLFPNMHPVVTSCAKAVKKAVSALRRKTG